MVILSLTQTPKAFAERRYVLTIPNNHPAGFRLHINNGLGDSTLHQNFYTSDALFEFINDDLKNTIEYRVKQFKYNKLRIKQVLGIMK